MTSPTDQLPLPVRSDDPDTSHEAARTTPARRRASELAVLAALSFGIFTDEQLVAYLQGSGQLDHTPQRLRTARCRLARLGDVVLLGWVRNARGRRAKLWGRAHVERAHQFELVDPLTGRIGEVVAESPTEAFRVLLYNAAPFRPQLAARRVGPIFTAVEEAPR